MPVCRYKFHRHDYNVTILFMPACRHIHLYGRILNIISSTCHSIQIAMLMICFHGQESTTFFIAFYLLDNNFIRFLFFHFSFWRGRASTFTASGYVGLNKWGHQLRSPRCDVASLAASFDVASLTASFDVASLTASFDVASLTGSTALPKDSAPLVQHTK